MKHSIKRLLALLLALTLALGTLPVTALALEPEEPEILPEAEIEPEETEDLPAPEEEPAPAELEEEPQEEEPAPAEPEEETFTVEEVEEETVTEEAKMSGAAVKVPYAGSVKAQGGSEWCYPISAEDTRLDGGWYAVTEDVALSQRLELRGDVNLILCDGATLTAPYGIHVGTSRQLVIWGQSGGTGTLVASNQYTGDDDNFLNAAIGGNCGDTYTNSTSITIQGGTINATSTGAGAAIGGGALGLMDIVINGGTVHATHNTAPGSIGAAIGSGGTASTTIINGGTVYAEGCPGIGGGSGAGNVYIHGGIITAVGGYKSPGIGGGPDNPAGLTMAMDGGVLTAVAGYWNDGENPNEQWYVQAIGSGWPDYNFDYVNKKDTHQGYVDLADGCNVLIGQDAEHTRLVTEKYYMAARGNYNGYGYYSTNFIDENEAPDFHYVQIKYFEPPAPDPNPGDTSTFDIWTTSNALPTEGGGYRLTTDVTLSEGWTAPAGVVTSIDLNGYTITGAAGNYVLKVQHSGAVLNLYDTSAEGAGSITGGAAGVLVSAGTFQMYGGTITGNHSTSGTSGVNVKGGNFRLYGGAITKNSGYDCGGVNVEKGDVKFYGGAITGNTCSSSYGGGGVYVWQGSLGVSGLVNIEGNVSSRGGEEKPSNVFLSSEKTITLLDTLDPDSRIGITTRNNPTDTSPLTVTSGFSGKADAGSFFLDDTGSDYQLHVLNGELKKTTPMFTMTFVPGEGSGAMDSVSGLTSVTLPECTFQAPAGKAFVGWKIWEETCQPGASYNITADVEAHALWGTLYVMSFQPGEGSGAMDPISDTTEVTLPLCTFQPPEGKVFDCWKIGEVEYQPGDVYPITADVTAVAQWKTGTPYTDLVERLADGQSVTLTADAIFESGMDQLQVPAGKSASLNLNGHTLRLSNDDGSVATGPIQVFGSLSIVDESSDKTGKIIGGTAENGGCVAVESGGHLSLIGGTLTGGHADNGGGVFVAQSASFTMVGGAIEGNSAGSNGGGVYLQGQGSSCLMVGGTISGNTAGQLGGGVYLGENAGYQMITGIIDGNTANMSTGGVFLATGANMSISDGTISNNTAKQFAPGGVEICNGATLTMGGGTITGNRCSWGVGGVENNGTLNLYSAPNISGNLSAKLVNNSIARDENGNVVYEPGDLYPAQPVTVKSGLAPSASIGIYLYASNVENGPKVITSGLSGNGALSNFPLDPTLTFAELYLNEDGEVAARKAEPVTEVPTEAPTEAPTDAPTQAPTDAPTQAPTEAPTQAPTEAPTQAPTEVPTQAAVDLSAATVTAAQQTYTGKALTPAPTVTLGGKTLEKGTDYDVSYQNNINAGTAKVIVTGKGGYTGTAAGTFAIKKAGQTMTVTVPDSVAKGKTVTVKVSGAVGKVSITSGKPQIAKVTGTKVKGLKLGSATLTVKAAGDANHNPVTKKVNLTVTALAAPNISKVENVSGGVKITIGKVKGAVKYRYFYQKGNGKWTKAGDSDTNTFTWKKAANGVQYSFSACCLDKNSKVVSGYNKPGKSIVYIAAPTLKNTAAKTMKVSWKKAAGITGYQVQYALKANFSGAKTVKITKAGTLNTTVKNLGKGKTWYVRIRTYTVKNGKTTYSAWSGTTNIKLNK